MRAVHGLMAAVFGFSALLQLNDPDPWGWVLIYAVAAALSALAATGRHPAWRRPAALTIAVAAVVWALVVAFSSPRLPPLGDLVGDWAMYGAGIEERRETLGLLLLACWMAFVALPPRRAVSPGTS